MEISKASIPVQSTEVSFDINSPWSSSIASKQPVRKRTFKFIKRLTEMLSDTKYSEVVSWNEDGSIINIKEDKTFINKVLPIYFKHCSMPNFVRQLNMYDFKKVKECGSSVIGYRNHLFNRDQTSLSLEIIRKTSSKSLMTKSELKMNRMPKQNSDFSLKEDMNNAVNINSSKYSSRATYSKKLRSLKQQLVSLERKIENIEVINRTLIEDNSQVSASYNYLNRLEALFLNLAHHVLNEIEHRDSEGLPAHVDKNIFKNPNDLRTASVIQNTELWDPKSTLSYHNLFPVDNFDNIKLTENETCSHQQLLGRKSHISRGVRKHHNRKLQCNAATFHNRELCQDNQVLIDIESNAEVHPNLIISTEFYFSKNLMEEPVAKPYSKILDYDFDMHDLANMFYHEANEASTTSLNSGESNFSDTNLFN